MSFKGVKLCSILLGATLLSLAGIDVVFGQTVEMCTLQNVVIDVGPNDTEFWHPNFEPKIIGPYRGTIEYSDPSGTEIIVLKSTPLTHCESNIRYSMKTIPSQHEDTEARVSALFMVDSRTGEVQTSDTINEGEIGTTYSFYLYTYYDFEGANTVACPTGYCDPRCGTFCCRDFLRSSIGQHLYYDEVLEENVDPCPTACPGYSVYQNVFNPTRAHGSDYICTEDERDRDRIQVDISIVDSNRRPTFTSCPSTITILDDTSVGSLIAQAAATDPNAGLNGTFRFTLTQRLPTPQSGIYFTIDTVNGEIFTAGALDYNRRSIFDLLVTVSDLAVDPLSSLCEITVNVQAAAETPPVFPHDPIVVYIDEIPDNSPVYFVNQRRQIFNFEAYDPNTGSVENMHYNLKEYNLGALATLDTLTFGDVEFFVDEHARALYVRGPVDREKKSSYTFEVQAYRTQTTQFKDATVLVYVNDVNEQPYWPQSDYITYLSERAEVGDIVYHLTAQDIDVGINAELRYSMTDEILSETIDGDEEYFDTDSVFTVDQFGVIRVNQLVSFGYYRYFQFTAKTTDTAGSETSGLSAETEILIIIVDVNDHEPMFVPLNYTQIKCENHGGDTVIPHFLITVTVVDPDHGNAGAVNFAITGTYASSFRFYDVTYVYPHFTSMNANVTTTAKVENTAALDAESIDLYVLNIDATELTTDDPKVGHGHMFFRVCDYNDHVPYFEQPSGYTVSVQENVQEYILIVRVFDDDRTIQNTLSTLSITGGNPNSLFHLQAAQQYNTWFLWAVNLDYEMSTRHVLTLTATNEAQTYLNDCHDICRPNTLSQSVEVVVDVIDRNDNCPFFQPTHYDNIPINENSASGTFIVTLTALDLDQPDTAQSTPRYYMKSDTGRGLFQVENSTGRVTVHQPPDFEDIHQITLGVFVHDLGGAHEDYLCPEIEATVEIDIVNLNDNPPLCVGCPYYVDCVPEDATLGHFVVKVITSDLDWDGLRPGLRAGSPVSYSIVSQTRDGTFVINDGVSGGDDDTGVITVNNSALLDREMYSGDTHTITVRAFDGLNNSPDIIITVRVCDVNDNCPTFTSDRVITATVSESDEGGAAGSQVTLSSPLATSDIDVTDINRDTAYVISDSDPPNPPFRLDRYTGEVFVSSLGVDYDDDVRRWVLTIATFDEANLNCPLRNVAAAYATLTIDVTNSNDQDPVFSTIEYRPPAISEGTISNGIIVQVLDVSDPDGFGVTVTSTLEPNIPSGAIYPEQQEDQWVLKVAGVTNVDPVTLDRDNTALTRNPLSGNLLYIVSLTATDSPAPGGTRTRQAFATAYIEVYDINDNTPDISPDSTIQRNVPENAHAGYVVSHVAATDADWGTNADIHYYLDPLQTDFTIGSDSGAITTLTALDHERISSYTFQACAADRGTPQVLSACVGVEITVGDVQDNCPLLTVNPLSVSVNEGRPDVDTNIGISISAEDRDSTSAQNTITLSLNGGSNPHFGIVTDTSTAGSVTAHIDQLASGTPLDHETLNVHHLTITASDGQCSDSVVVKVVVEDLPDEPPHLTSPTYSGSVREDVLEGSIVPVTPSIGAADLDILLDTNQQDPDDTLTFSLVSLPASTSIDSVFSINQDSLDVSVRQDANLDYETTMVYTFDVVVTDTGGLTDTGRVMIQILDVNDNSPIWDYTGLYNAASAALATVTDESNGCYGITISPTVSGTQSLNLSVPETVAVNCPLFGPGVNLVNFVSDADSTTNAEIWFKADHGDDENIGLGLTYPVDAENSNDGIVYLHEQLDYEVKTLHTLTVRAIDRGTPPMSDSLFVYVHVLNDNDHYPLFERRNFLVVYCEETYTRLAVLRAVDLDGDNVTYSVSSVNPGALTSNVELRLVEESVEVWLNATDYETFKEVVIVIESNDNHPDRPLTDQAIITVTVLDVNDNVPVITNMEALTLNGEYTRDVLEDPFHPDEPIMTITGADRDDGFNQELHFEIVLQTPGSKFTLNAISGELWPAEILDYEEYPGPYRVDFRVCDRGDQGTNRLTCGEESHTKQCSTLHSVIINITNVADHPPLCPDVINDCVLEDNVNPIKQILNLTCTDADYPLDPEFEFSISRVIMYDGTDITGEGRFRIVPVRGAVGVLESTTGLDREEVNEYTITVEVMETHAGALTGLTTTVTIVLCIEDRNDESPMFPTAIPMEIVNCGDASVRISEDSSANHHLLNLAAHDQDLNPVLTYQIDSVTPDHRSYFLFAQNGSLIMINTVDFEELRDNFTTDTYQFMLSVSDGIHTDSITVCVQVTDANDNAPMFMPPSRNISVNECMGVGHLVDVTGFATDLDDPPNNQLIYALEDPTPSDPSNPLYVPFGVTEDKVTMSYWIDVTGALDYETIKGYDVVLVATDQPVDVARELSGHATVFIQVVDCADVTPCFNNTEWIVFAPENTTNHMSQTISIYDNLLNHVIDLDTVPENFYFFVINPGNLVEVGQESGEVFLHPQNMLDFEDAGLKELKVTVAVRNFNEHPVTREHYENSGFIDLVVRAIDINDNPPVIDTKPLYSRPGSGYLLIPVDHLTEYGDEVYQLTANDLDTNDFGHVQFKRYDPPVGEAFVFDVNSTGAITTLATFKDRVGTTYNFTVEAYDNYERSDPVYFSDFVVLKMLIVSNKNKVILRINVERETTKQLIDKVVGCIYTVTGRNTVVDYIRYAQSDDGTSVDPSDTDVIFLSLEEGSDVIANPRTMVHLLDSNFFDLNRCYRSEIFVSARVYPDDINLYETEIPGLIIAIIVIVIIIIIICCLCCVLCCWENRRRRSYKKKLAYLTFDESKLVTTNPLYVPAMEEVQETDMADEGRVILFDTQEIAVDMNREEEEEEDWLKMDEPPPWLRKELKEVEEYEEWAPPPVQIREMEITVPEPQVEVRTEVVVEQVRKEVVKEETKVEQEVDVQMTKSRPKRKPVDKGYDEQETELQMFPTYDSDGVDSDGELHLSRIPSELMSGDDDIEVGSTGYGGEAFQMDQQFDDDFLTDFK